MPYNPERHNRRSIRLPGYDYAQAGAYFVTICAHGRACVFGEIVDGTMRTNAIGEIVRDTWFGLATHYAGVVLDAFVVMPNHIHGVLILERDGAVTAGVGAGLKPAPTPVPPPNHVVGKTVKFHTLPEIVRGFKTFSARRINELRNMQGNPVWQRNYYESIVRAPASLARIRRYIEANPSRWADDAENDYFRHLGATQ